MGFLFSIVLCFYIVVSLCISVLILASEDGESISNSSPISPVRWTQKNSFVNYLISFLAFLFMLNCIVLSRMRRYNLVNDIIMRNNLAKRKKDKKILPIDEKKDIETKKTEAGLLEDNKTENQIEEEIKDTKSAEEFEKQTFEKQTKSEQKSRRFFGFNRNRNVDNESFDKEKMSSVDEKKIKDEKLGYASSRLSDNFNDSEKQRSMRLSSKQNDINEYPKQNEEEIKSKQNIDSQNDKDADIKKSFMSTFKDLLDNGDES